LKIATFFLLYHIYTQNNFLLLSNRVLVKNDSSSSPPKVIIQGLRNERHIETFVDKFLIFPSFRGEINFEFVIGLALTGIGDVGAVTLRMGE